MPTVLLPEVLPPGVMRACRSAAFSQSRRCAVGPELVSDPGSRGGVVSALAPPVSDPEAGGVAVDCPGGVVVDCPGVGAGVGPVPLGTRLSVVPVPGVPDWDGNVNDCPGVGAGVGPVPLGTELPGVEVPGADPLVADPVPALPAPPAPPAPLVPPLPPVPPLWPSELVKLQPTSAAASSPVFSLESMGDLRSDLTENNVASPGTFRRCFREGSAQSTTVRLRSRRRAAAPRSPRPRASAQNRWRRTGSAARPARSSR
jgi:hypothetical protein